jgi:hypothetical protein
MRISGKAEMRREGKGRHDDLAQASLRFGHPVFFSA